MGGSLAFHHPVPFVPPPLLLKNGPSSTAAVWYPCGCSSSFHKNARMLVPLSQVNYVGGRSGTTLDAKQPVREPQSSWNLVNTHNTPSQAKSYVLRERFITSIKLAFGLVGSCYEKELSANNSTRTQYNQTGPQKGQSGGPVWSFCILVELLALHSFS